MIVAILLIPIIVIAAICYFIYRIALRFNYPKLGIVIVAGLIVFIAFNIYTAIYPNDDFYFDEYKNVTLRHVPKSAVIIRKSASYPDTHGDYSSAALMELSSADYTTLLSSLKADQKFLPNQKIEYSEEFDYVMPRHKEKDIVLSFVRPLKEHEEIFFYIGFLNDKHTILIYRVSS